MGNRKYTLVECIHEGLDYKAETILSKTKPMFNKLLRLLKSNGGTNDEDILEVVKEIQDKLFDEGGGKYG